MVARSRSSACGEAIESCNITPLARWRVFLRQFLESLSLTEWLVIAGCGLACLLVLLVWWLIAGPAPRRRRGTRQLQKLLAQGKWSDVLAALPAVRAIGRPNQAWQRSFTQIE